MSSPLEADRVLASQQSEVPASQQEVPVSQQSEVPVSEQSGMSQFAPFEDDSQLLQLPASQHEVVSLSQEALVRGGCSPGSRGGVTPEFEVPPASATPAGPPAPPRP
jgi:hypothetical protein